MKRSCTYGDAEHPVEILNDLSLRDVQIDYLINEKRNQSPPELVQIFETSVFTEREIASPAKVGLKIILYPPHFEACAPCEEFKPVSGFHQTAPSFSFLATGTNRGSLRYDLPVNLDLPICIAKSARWPSQSLLRPDVHSAALVVPVGRSGESLELWERAFEFPPFLKPVVLDSLSSYNFRFD
jgi:hypothetical protein